MVTNAEAAAVELQSKLSVLQNGLVMIFEDGEKNFAAKRLVVGLPINVEERGVL